MIYAKQPMLIAEDDDNDFCFFEMALRDSGVSFRRATDGEEAILYLSGQGEYADRAIYPAPRLITLDLNMPKMGGFDVLEWIQQNPSLGRIPVVVLTSSDSEEDMRQALSLGAYSYLVKPTRAAEFVALMRLIKSYWLDWNQLPKATPNSASNGHFHLPEKTHPPRATA